MFSLRSLTVAIVFAQLFLPTASFAQENSAPTITSPTVNSLPFGSSYSFTVTALDPDGDEIIYSIQNPSAGMAIDQSSGQFS